MKRLLQPLTSLLLLSALAVPIAFGGEREQAELERMVEDINRFADRQVWSGVERRYEQILALHDVQIPREVHLQAAHAARANGNMDAALDRLERAAAIKRSDEVDAWIVEINENYGRVQLMTVPPRSVKLTARNMPLQPDQRQSITTAIEALDEDGEFIGMLPAGSYSLAGRDFEVVPGVGTTVELSAKELRAEKKRQRAEPAE